MAWSTTDWTAGNIQRYADEFWKAVKERKVAIVEDVSGFLIPQSGAILQSASTNLSGSATGVFSFRWIQDWIYSYTTCYKFIRSHDADGNIYNTPTTGDGLMNLFCWTPNQLLASVSGDLAMDQFRRATTWPLDWADWSDPAYSLGKIQPGDIMGPWIFADIQSALNKLIWTTLGSRGFTANAANNSKFGTYTPPRGGGGWEKDWPTAVAEAEASYDVSSFSADGAPYCYSCGGSYYAPEQSGCEAYLYRRYGWMYAYNMVDTMAREIDWGFRASRPSEYSGYVVQGFDNNGDAVVEGNNYLGTSVHAAGSGTTYIYPTCIGNNITPEEYPNWVTDPETGRWTGILGYSCGSATILTRWNVPGGFEYQ